MGEQPKRTNGLGIAAFIVAIVGFIFACMPGALIIGWVLLPIGFILGLVAIFLKGKVKWQAVSAVIISVVGTIVGFVVFFVAVGNAIGDAVEENSNVNVTSSDAAEVD
jgi:glycopeptide antibiotics resistance protein